MSDLPSQAVMSEPDEKEEKEVGEAPTESWLIDWCERGRIPDSLVALRCFVEEATTGTSWPKEPVAAQSLTPLGRRCGAC